MHILTQKIKMSSSLTLSASSFTEISNYNLYTYIFTYKETPADKGKELFGFILLS